MKFQNVKLGADPELFLMDKKGNYVSAIGKIGGTKDEPRPVDENGAAVQEDNVACEFNIAPASNVREFIQNLRVPLSYIRGHVGMMGLKPAIIPSAIFSEAELADPMAKVFGCDPDYNAWTGKVNPKPHCDNPALRTCGGHVHVSWDGPDMDTRKLVIRAMDLFLGVPSVMMDDDSRRRLLYGKAGAHRAKKYGVEYRVLSNFWILSPTLMRWAFNQTHRALEYVEKQGDGQLFDPGTKANILSAINDNDKVAARSLISRFNLSVV